MLKTISPKAKIYIINARTAKVDKDTNFLIVFPLYVNGCLIAYSLKLEIINDKT